MKKYLIIAAAVALALSGCKNTPAETPVKKVDAQKFFKENIEKVEALCMEERASDEAEFFGASYTYVDIDKDGVDELYVRDEVSDSGWLLCCGADTLQLVAAENYKLHLSQLGNILMLSGSAGTGAFYSGYYEIVNSSCVGPDFFELDEFVWGTEDSTATIYHPITDFDGDYPEEKTRPFFEKVNELKKTTDWELLNEGRIFKPIWELNGKVPEDEQE
jgi:hypothetical protein